MLKTGNPAKPDFAVSHHGTICLLQPLNAEARSWITEHIDNEEAQWFGSAVVVEPRYLQPILDGIREDGLSVL